VRGCFQTSEFGGTSRKGNWNRILLFFSRGKKLAELFRHFSSSQPPLSLDPQIFFLCLSSRGKSRFLKRRGMLFSNETISTCDASTSSLNLSVSEQQSAVSTLSEYLMIRIILNWLIQLSTRIVLYPPWLFFFFFFLSTGLSSPSHTRSTDRVNSSRERTIGFQVAITVRDPDLLSAPARGRWEEKEERVIKLEKSRRRAWWRWEEEERMIRHAAGEWGDR
jgi:hypothetical protein